MSERKKERKKLLGKMAKLDKIADEELVRDEKPYATSYVDTVDGKKNYETTVMLVPRSESNLEGNMKIHADSMMRKQDKREKEWTQQFIDNRFNEKNFVAAPFQGKPDIPNYSDPMFRERTKKNRPILINTQEAELAGLIRNLAKSDPSGTT